MIPAHLEEVQVQESFQHLLSHDVSAGNGDEMPDAVFLGHKPGKGFLGALLEGAELSTPFFFRLRRSRVHRFCGSISAGICVKSGICRIASGKHTKGQKSK
jgi:hypothetical protein